LTAEDLQAFGQQIARLLQSQMDKRDRRLEGLLNAQTLNARTAQALKTAGVEVPADKQATLLAQLREQGVIPAGEPDDDAPVNGAAPNAPDPVQVQGQQIADTYGLTDADPEWAEMVQAVSQAQTPQAYLRAIQAAGQKRLARAMRAPQPNPAQMPGLVPGGTPAKPILSDSAEELYRQEWNNVLNARNRR
jgi:hypothetical protein